MCEHLRRIGLDATVESKEYKKGITSSLVYTTGWVMGSVRVANRNINLVELWWRKWGGGSTGEYTGEYDSGPMNEYRCNYVVQEKVGGSEDKLRAFSRPITKGFFSRNMVDFKCGGKRTGTSLEQR